MAKPRGLGKGLDSLIPNTKKNAEEKKPIEKPEIKSEAKSEKKAENTADKNAEEKKTVKAEKKPEAKAEVKPEAKTEVKSEPKAAVKAEPKTEVKAESKAAAKPAEGKEKQENSGGPERMISIIKIEANRKQPRKKFDKESLEELAESIKEYGVIQPLVVRTSGDHFEIVAGERRWRAAKLAGLKELPVIVREYSDAEVAEIALVENLQREDLNPIEEAMGYQSLIKEFGLTQDQAAQRVSKSRTVVTNALRLLKLNKKVQKLVESGQLSTGHAKVLLGIEDLEKQYEAAEKVIEEHLSVRQTEQLVKSILNPAKPRVKEPFPSQEIYEDLRNRMTEKTGTKVVINRKSASKGKVEIEFYSTEDLERLAELMGIRM